MLACQDYQDDQESQDKPDQTERMVIPDQLDYEECKELLDQ